MFFNLYLTFFHLSPHQQGTIFSLSLGAESCDPEQPAIPTSVRNKRHRMEREAQRGIALELDFTSVKGTV